MRRIVAGRYAVKKEAGRSGGQATVVKAADLDTDTDVALKLIPRGDVDATHQIFFRREVEALRRLRHPNIVSLLDFGEDEQENAFYVVLEWVDKRLEEVLAPPEDLGWDDFAEQWAMPLLDALAYAHEWDVVHRDVKPANILVGEDLVPKLADFGISKIRSKISPSEATVVDFVSRPYAPPDLVGLNNASRDVFGFAVTVLRCLTSGRLEDYPDIPIALDDVDVPPEVHALLAECTSMVPEARPQNAIILRSRLRDIQRQRQQKWVRPLAAELQVREPAAKRLAQPPLDRDADAVERALEAELSHGTHLVRVRDSKTSQLLVDTLDLVGARRRLRLGVDQEHARFVVTRVNDDAESSLDSMRQRGWPVSDQVRWTSRRQPPAGAREAMTLILNAVDEHYLRLDDEQHVRDENRLFDKWLDLLAAKEDLERERLSVLPYERVEISGREARFHLTTTPESDVVGQERVCRVSGATVGGVGVVVEQDGSVVTLRYARIPKILPSSGQLVLDIGPAAISLRRQRDAVSNVRAGVAVRPQLRELLLDPTLMAVPRRPESVAWFNEALDDNKKSAVATALGSDDFFLLEGPPGTGKTRFIAELVQQEMRRNPDSRILLVSQTHVAVDNALVRLDEAGVTGLVRLGRTDDPRIDLQARRHLLDHQMPAWVKQIRKRAEQHLKTRALEASIEPNHVEAAAIISELVRFLHEASRVQARLAAVEQARVAGVTSPASEFGDEEATSEIAALNDRLQGLDERVTQLREQANTALKDALTLPDPLSEETARAAFDAVVGDDPNMKQLVGLLRLQAEWFQRIESSRELEGVLLRRARVVAGTCLGFLGHPDVRDLEFDLCILDEASKATATETLVPLARATRWVLVGDPRQLPPMQEEVLDHPALLQRHALERADVEQTLFQRLLDHAPEHAKYKLTQQYRMQQGIGDLVSTCFYDNDLQSESTHTLHGWDKLYKPVTWLDTSQLPAHRETRSGAMTSAVNYCEVKAIRHALDVLRGGLEKEIVRPKDPPLRILVLTAYRRQMEELRRGMASVNSPLLDIEVNTVDAVQGREADVTFYSVVRSNERGDLGFLGPLYWRRINVALSRSRFGLVIVGDAPFCETNSGPLNEVLDYMRKNPTTCLIGKAAHA